MTYKTYSELKTIIEKELDLETEDFVQPTELLDYFNRGVKEAEASIHKLGVEDNYFKKPGLLTLASGSSSVALPSDIYATKIKKIVYANGNQIFEIRRMRDKDKLMRKKIMDLTPGSNPIYEYDLANASAAAGITIELHPPAQETSTTNVAIEYIREAAQMVNDSDPCDIPEFYTFVLAFVRWKVKDKEGSPDSDSAKQDYERERLLMVETLENQVPDDESEIEKDISSYEEMS